MQSAASSAGYSTGGTLISAFAAYMLLNPEAPLSFSRMLGWVFFLAVLGVTMAIPMKRQMVNIEQLRFPSGIAAAETLRALHSHGDKGMRAAKALGISGAIAAYIQFWADGLRVLGEKIGDRQGFVLGRLRLFPQGMLAGSTCGEVQFQGLRRGLDASYRAFRRRSHLLGRRRR